MITIIIEGFYDGLPVKRELTGPSRWEVQEAEKVTLIFGRRNASSSAETSTSTSTTSTTSTSTTSTSTLSIDLVQLPRSLSSSKIGVGAVLWDGGIVLAALLASSASASASGLFGETVVELGAGVGAPSLVAARRGARVVATDREAAVTGVLRMNALPFMGEKGSCCRLPPDPGKIKLEVLEFGTAGGDAAAAALADAICSSSSSSSFSSSSSSSSTSSSFGGGGGVDLVLAADCCYVDGADEAATPDPRGLCRAAARLLLRPLRDSGGKASSSASSCSSSPSSSSFSCPPSSRAWVAAELRDARTHALFSRAAEEHFASVRRLQLPREVFSGNRGGGRAGGGGGGAGGESGESGEENDDDDDGESDGGGWGHVRVFELAGPRAEAALGIGCSASSFSAAEMRALKKPRKRGWP